MIPHKIVATRYNQYARYRLIFNVAHAGPTGTEETMRMQVLNVPTGTLSTPCGHTPGAASRRRKMYAEKSAPKSITSEARKSHMPTLAFQRPVSGRVEIV